ncbi:hypothetical protein AB205_0037460, partial [Aquarana catesbeiana]
TSVLIRLPEFEVGPSFRNLIFRAPYPKRCNVFTTFAIILAFLKLGRAYENMNVKFKEPEFLSAFIDKYREMRNLWEVKHPQYYLKHIRKSTLERLLTFVQTFIPEATMEILLQKIGILRNMYKREHNMIQNSLRSGTSADDDEVSQEESGESGRQEEAGPCVRQEVAWPSVRQEVAWPSVRQEVAWPSVSQEEAGPSV